jgi:hypothetical protein
MKIDLADAAKALKDIGRAEQRTETFTAYARAGQSLVVWGLVWAAANALTGWIPGHRAVIWFPALAVGAVASVLLQRGQAWDWRRPAAVAVVLAAGWSIALVSGPPTGATWNALIALVAATAYLLLGIWKGFRFCLVGVALGGLTLVGYLGFRERFDLWMSVVGGGGLVLGGVWLQRL